MRLTMQGMRPSAVRVAVDPNRTTGPRGQQTFVLMSSVSGGAVAEGSDVLAVEQEDDGPDWVAPARVDRVDEEHGLVYLTVQWSAMAPERIADVQTARGTIHVVSEFGCLPVEKVLEAHGRNYSRAAAPALS